MKKNYNKSITFVIAAYIIFALLVATIAKCAAQSDYRQLHDVINVSHQYYRESTTTATISVAATLTGVAMMTAGIVGNSLNNDSGMACYLHHGGTYKDWRNDYPVQSGLFGAGAVLTGFGGTMGVVSITFKFKAHKEIRKLFKPNYE